MPGSTGPPATGQAGGPKSRLRTIAPTWASAVAGALAAGVAIAVSELVAGVVHGAPSLVASIGGLVISLQPPGAKDFMVSLFGTNDKLALNVAVVLISLALAASAGILGARRSWIGAAIFVAFGVLAGAAALRDPLASPGLAVANAGGAVIASLVALLGLLGLASEPAARTGGRPAGASGGDRGGREPEAPEWTRRRFLIASAGTLGGVVVAVSVGRTLLDAEHADAVVS